MCGINGNCICPRFYYGLQCDTVITTGKRVQLRELGMNSSGVFLICFFFLVVFPFLLYILYHSLIHCCRKDDDSYCAMLKDAFCCFGSCNGDPVEKEIPQIEDLVEQVVEV